MGQNVCVNCIKRQKELSEVTIVENPGQSHRARDIDLIQIHKTLDSLAEDFFELLDDNSGFEVIVDNPECRVEGKEADLGNVIKFYFELPFTPQDFFQFTAQTELRTEWDLNVQSISTIYSDKYLRINHTVYKKIAIISARESLLASKKIIARGNQLDLSTSVELESVPKDEFNVRVKVKLGGYYFEKVDDALYRVTGISYADFGFSPQLSKVARKISATAMPKFIQNLKKGLKKFKNY